MEFTSHVDLILEVIYLNLFLSHFRVHKSKNGLEIADPVKQILLRWAQAKRLYTPFAVILFAMRDHLCNACVTLSAREYLIQKLLERKYCYNKAQLSYSSLPLRLDDGCCNDFPC